MSQRLALVTALAFAFLLVLPTDTIAQSSRRERKAAAQREAEKPRPVKGGELLEIARSYDETYNQILDYFKRNDYLIEVADREIGQIFTAFEITRDPKKKARQIGTRVLVTLFRENDSSTTVKVAVTTQTRIKRLMAEPWKDLQLDEEQSKSIAAEMKEHLEGATDRES